MITGSAPSAPAGRTMRVCTDPVGPPGTVTHSSSISGLPISPDCTWSTVLRLQGTDGHRMLSPGGRARTVGSIARGAAVRAAVVEQVGLVAGGDRLLPRAGGPTGPKRRSQPARPGSKHHVLTDRQGIPLAVSLTGENTCRTYIRPSAPWSSPVVLRPLVLLRVLPRELRALFVSQACDRVHHLLPLSRRCATSMSRSESVLPNEHAILWCARSSVQSRTAPPA